MTTKEKVLTSPAKESTIEPPSDSVAVTVEKKKKASSLRNRLLTNILPAFLLSLAIPTAVELIVVTKETEQNLFKEMENNLVLTREVTETIIEGVEDTVELMTVNPYIIEALKKVESDQLLQKSIEEIEQEFASTKLLDTSLNLNQYLIRTAETGNLAEIIITDRHGFNVAYNTPTTDFVQSDEEWWKKAVEGETELNERQFDDSTQTEVIEIAKSIKDLESDNLLGVIRVSVPIEEILEEVEEGLLDPERLKKSEQVQIIDITSEKTIATIAYETTEGLAEVIGGEPVLEVIRLAQNAYVSEELVENVINNIKQIDNIDDVKLEEWEGVDREYVITFESGNKLFSLTSIPKTNLVAITSIDYQEILRSQFSLIGGFIINFLVASITAIIVIILLAQKLSKPLTNLTTKTKEAAEGNLDVRAEIEGTSETQILADNFNKLVEQVKNLLGEVEIKAEEQRKGKEVLEQEIFELLNEVGDAAEGDLTVRASLTSMEMSTVADLFNAIIDNLNDIASQVKQSSTIVSYSLKNNEKSLQLLAQEAISEANTTRDTLGSVEEMSNSINKVAQNANQAATLANDAYNATQAGKNSIDNTVTNFLELRTTVGETVKKMKRLGESSQKISQVVSLIEEIALKTNLLAINASVEASRAGELGQGFTVVAEQVGALAEQSVAATKEISKIVSTIQTETQEVSEAMELETSQMVASSQLVESTKTLLESVLERSHSINELMQSISQATVSQVETSTTVTNLMQEIAHQSEQRATSSQQVAESIEATAQVAQDLESAVDKFKVK